MKILVKRPLEEAEIIENTGGIEGIEDIVEGYTELVPLPYLGYNGIALLVNDNGKMLNLNTNLVLLDNGVEIDHIVGNMVFVRVMGEDLVSLTNEQLDYLFDTFPFLKDNGTVGGVLIK